MVLIQMEKLAMMSPSNGENAEKVETLVITATTTVNFGSINYSNRL